jgi:hypothetical protein
MASGGVLIYMSTKSPGNGGSSILAGSDAGFVTGDADRTDLPPLPFPAASHITYHGGRISGDVTTSQSADLSKGNGFLAPAIDGSYTILDPDGLIAIDIANGSVNPVGWDVWVAFIPSGGTASNIGDLVQLQSTDIQLADGTVTVIAKSPAYLGNQPLYGVRTLTTLSTDPIDPTNPTDPTYLVAGTASQFAGMGFGNTQVSLKCADALPANTLAYYKKTPLVTGDITTAGTGANITAVNPTVIFDSLNGTRTYATDPAIISDYAALAGFGYQSFAAFICNSYTEAVHFYTRIQTLASAGYSLALSDGQWFLDFSALVQSPSELFSHSWGLPPTPGSSGAYTRIVIFTSGTDFATSLCGVAFFLDKTIHPENSGSIFTESLFPRTGIDATSCLLYASLGSVALAHGQIQLDGFAKGETTVPAIGSTSLNAEHIAIFHASSVESDNIISYSLFDAKIMYKVVGSAHHLGGITDHAVSNTLSGGGDLATIHMNPELPYQSGTAPLHFGGNSYTHYGQLNSNIGLCISLNRINPPTCDFLCVESTWQTVIGGSLDIDATVYSAAFGPFENLSDQAADFGHQQIQTYPIVMQGNANRFPIIPKWSTYRRDLTDMTDSLTPAFRFQTHVDIIGPLTCTASMHVYDCFIYAYSRISFSSIYATIYPFWTRKSCSALATNGTGTVLAGGAGLGALAADGSIAWTPFDMGAAVVRSAAYGASTWVQVGYLGDDYCFWSSADGVNWTKGIFGTTHVPNRVRYVGGYFVCLFYDGTWAHSSNGTTWTSHTALSTGLQDVAYDGAKWHFVGSAFMSGSEKVAWTSSLTTASFTDYTPTGIVNTQCVTVFDGVVIVSSGNGRMWTCPLSSLNSSSWTMVILNGSGSIYSITQNTQYAMAVSTTGMWTWLGGSASWVKSDSSDPIWFEVDKPEGIHSTVGGNEFWIAGGGAQIATAEAVPLLTWTPWATRTPSEGLANIAGRYFGGLTRSVYGGDSASLNPVQWAEPIFDAATQDWGIAFDPPTAAINDYSGTNADAGARTIAAEWWAFAGEMHATTLDGSNDAIEEGFPEIALGNIEDVATIITVQYAPFGGAYLKSAYIQNVDVDRETAGQPDVYFFSGWDVAGINTCGLALWTECRNTWLKTRILRATALTFDSVHDETTLGLMWTTVDADLGPRIRWLCNRPRYLKLTMNGNDCQAALAQCGTRYQPNTAMLVARGLGALNPSGYGVVVQADHDYINGVHTLDIAFPPPMDYQWDMIGDTGDGMIGNTTDKMIGGF